METTNNHFTFVPHHTINHEKINYSSPNRIRNIRRRYGANIRRGSNIRRLIEMKTTIEPLTATSVKLPTIKMQECWLVGATETLLNLCGISYAYLESYEIEMVKDIEPGEACIKIRVDLPNEWKFFHVRRLSSDTTIDKFNSLVADACENINRWIARKI